MKDSLELRYRRLLALYPRTYRAANEQEILGVLMAGSGAGRVRPDLAESLDLARGALRMRLRSGSLDLATALMCLCAVFELAALAVVLATESALKTSIARALPHTSWHSVYAAHILPAEIGAPIVAAIWLTLAWASRRRYSWVGAGAAVMFTLTSVSMFGIVLDNGVNYAPADFAVSVVTWLTTDRRHHRPDRRTLPQEPRARRLTAKRDRGAHMRAPYGARRGALSLPRHSPATPTEP